MKPCFSLRLIILPVFGLCRPFFLWLHFINRTQMRISQAYSDQFWSEIKVALLYLKKNNTERIAERIIENEKHWPLFISIQTFVKYVNLKNCGRIYVIFALLMFGGLFVKSALQNDSAEHPHIYSLQINFWSIILIIFIKIIWQDIPEVNPSVLIGSHSVVILSVNKFWLNKFGPTTT